MQPLCRLLLILALAVSPAAHAGGSAVAWIALGIWTSLLPRPAPPEPSPHHIRAEQAPPPARDACTFVAGVRHCPSAQPR
ncbi:MAG TPA: hypothetical protein VF004_08505 [Burkholderiales bacterium]